MFQEMSSKDESSLVQGCSGTGVGSAGDGTAPDHMLSSTEPNNADFLQDNYILRQKLMEVTIDRDRLVCENSKLRLELDMVVLKRLPDESFPQKPGDRTDGISYEHPTAVDTITSAQCGGAIGGGYGYVQQAPRHNASPQQVSYQHHHLQYPMCTPAVVQSSAATSQPILIPANMTRNQHHHYVHHGHHHQGNGNAYVMVPGNCVGIACPPTTTTTVHKKNSLRSNGDVIKRARAQTAYELSQDLLEKQIELLERKYGGVGARNAAITIQRAFRHYMMVKKFASITAMAKAEKRLSRRMLISVDESNDQNCPVVKTSGAQGIPSEHFESNYNQQQQPKVMIMAGPPAMVSANRIPPTRSMSLRERRHLDTSPLPRTQGAASANNSHPHVNLLHSADQQYYNVMSAKPGNVMQYYYAGQAPHPHDINQLPHDVSYSSNISNLETSIDSSWTSGHSHNNSPNTPYYTAAQIYMRPRGTVTPSSSKKIPPEVPKRTSSMTTAQQQQLLRQIPPMHSPSINRSNGLYKTSENGSLTSVQSSGSDSSITSAERAANCDLSSDHSCSSHTWKRGTNLNSSNQFSNSSDLLVMVSPATACNPIISDDSISSHTSAAQYEQQDQNEQIAASQSQNFKISETMRKRQYRVGLNLFNKKPEKGIAYLILRGFLENTPQGVARFLISRKGLSRQMIGEYLGNIQNQFNMAVLECFVGELDLSGMQVDVALRKFQAYFRMPGEAQKIERLMEIFSQRYCQCNSDIVGRLRSSDTIFVLAFAIIMLNTDLHTPNLKPERRMRIEDFIKNLRGIDDCTDIDRDMLAGIYERVKANEFKPGSDHVTQVMKVQATIVGKKPNLALPHRRLVCYCRLYEIPDINKKERPGVHQREVFLFNDLLVITKIFSKKKSSVTYTFRNSFPLCGMIVTILDVANYPYCIQLSQKVDGKILVTFNARNEHDRCKFAEDLKESISEMDEMESLRIEAELDRQKSARNRAPVNSCSNSENRDSGVADVEVGPCPFQSTQGIDPSLNVHDSASQLKRSALSNSLLDIHEQFGNDRPQRRGSVGSLDSGMSISFQSTTASSASRENAAMAIAAANTKVRYPPPPGSGQQQQHTSQQLKPNYAVSIPRNQQQHGQQQPQSGRIIRERVEYEKKKTDESGHSTEV